jgi:DNA-directed RNA polymerase III subunit RPC8
LLFPNSVFEPEEGVWVWHNNAGNDDPEEDAGEDQLYFDNGNTVRFRVEAEFWTDQAPDGSKKPAAAGLVGGLPGGVENGNGGEQQQQRKVPWRLEGSMAEPGLGDVMWW